MSTLVERFGSRTWSRLALFGVIAASAAGCSAESARFADSTGSLGRSSGPAADPAGSVPVAQGAPLGRVEALPLPQQQTAALPPPPPPQQAAAPAPIRTAAAQPAPAAAPRQAAAHAPSAGGRWEWDGGTSVIVKKGETLQTIARKHSVPMGVIMQANSISSPEWVHPGYRLTIPRHIPTLVTRVGTTAAPPAAAAGAKASAPQIAGAVHVVAPVENPPVTESPKNEPTAAAAPGFRWPVRGRVITGFGPKPTGQQNDGINVAVPEGTPVKAAEDGVVAYAGSELKGYGNLVLVRHSNGFVTAYAHASELSVKKGESIKRGQVIGKAGATGNVTSPQLHFEVRKGATPVDPAQYLSGG